MEHVIFVSFKEVEHFSLIGLVSAVKTLAYRRVGVISNARQL